MFYKDKNMDKSKVLQTLKFELAEKEKQFKIAEMNKFGLSKMSLLIENNLDQAKLLIATQDVIEKLQKIASRLAELNADEIMPLADSMKAAFGPEVAQQFEHVASQSILAAQDSVRAAKDAIDSAVLKVEGKMVTSDDTDMAQYKEPESDTDLDNENTPEDSSNTDDTLLSNEVDNPPLGREVKDSVEYSKRPLSESSQSLRRVRAIASIIETNIKNSGKANTSEIISKFTKGNLNEESTQDLLEKFVTEYGCTPALYSAKIKKMMAENSPTTGDKADSDTQNMNSTEQAQSQAVNDIASQVASNPGVLNQPISSVASNLPPDQKNAVNTDISNNSNINSSTTVKDYLQKQSNSNP